jgi:hypothetical protein
MSSIPTGLVQAQDVWGEYNNVRFAIQQAIAKIQTATLVQVVSCTNDGDASPVGSVNVLILVNQINGAGQGLPEGQLVNLPYLRLQGGANAVILDPQPGDIGIAIFCSRDISTVVSTKAQANPATFRMYDFSDGLYLGGVLNGAPTQYIQFNSAGITIVSPTVTIQGNLNVTGDVVANGISLDTHVHSGVQTGSGDTGPPV